VLLPALALLCTVLIGYAAHRASLCNVRAVADILQRRDPTMLLGLLQAVLWMAALTGMLVLAGGLVPAPAQVRMPLGWALAGGLLFGAGAALNGGCSLSTLHRLADGNLGMLATLGGFGAGVLAWVVVMEQGHPAQLTPVVSVWLRWPALAPWLLAALLLWVALRVRAFWRLARAAGPGALRAHVLAPSYPPWIAAALLGLSGGLLYATQGAWSYTSFLRSELVHGLGRAMAPRAWHAVLVAGLLAGMSISALQRRSLVWRGPGRLAGWLRHAAGGFLMGAGAALIPGGNDTLLLSGLPSLSATALGTYLFLLAGIAATLRLLRAG